LVGILREMTYHPIVLEQIALYIEQYLVKSGRVRPILKPLLIPAYPF